MSDGIEYVTMVSRDDFDLLCDVVDILLSDPANISMIDNLRQPGRDTLESVMSSCVSSPARRGFEGSNT